MWSYGAKCVDFAAVTSLWIEVQECLYSYIVKTFFTFLPMGNDSACQIHTLTGYVIPTHHNFWWSTSHFCWRELKVMALNLLSIGKDHYFWKNCYSWLWCTAFIAASAGSSHKAHSRKASGGINVNFTWILLQIFISDDADVFGWNYTNMTSDLMSGLT